MFRNVQVHAGNDYYSVTENDNAKPELTATEVEYYANEGVRGGYRKSEMESDGQRDTQKKKHRRQKQQQQQQTLESTTVRKKK